MKRILLLLLVSTLAFMAEAQPKYCLSYADFQEDNWLPLDTLFVNHQSKQRQLLIGGSEIKLTSGDKEVDKILKEKAFAVFYHDTIFVNCAKLQYDSNQLGKGYTTALRFGQNKLCFAGSTTLEKKAMSDMNMGSAIFGGGLIGGALAARSMRDEMAVSKGCFITKIEFRSGIVKIIAIDDNFVRQYLSTNPKLLEQYEQLKPKERLYAVHIIPLFREAGFIE